MKRFWQLRIGFMVVLLIAVIAFMRGLTPHKVSGFFSEMGMGLESSGGAQHTSARLTVCRTRLHAIIAPDGKRVEEAKDKLNMKWMSHTPTPHELPYIEVEKWLGRYCNVTAERKLPTEIAAETQWATWTFEFISGEPLQVERSGTDLFRIQGQIYRSTELSQALTELATIAGWQ